MVEPNTASGTYPARNLESQKVSKPIRRFVSLPVSTIVHSQDVLRSHCKTLGPISHHRHILSGLVLIAWMLTGCATMGPHQARAVACSSATVWDAVWVPMHTFPVTKESKQQGIIETGWIEQEAESRPYGLLQREGLGDRERTRLIVDVIRGDRATVLRLSEQREHYGFTGGNRIYQWYPREPSQEALDQMMATLLTRLKEKSCFIEP